MALIMMFRLARASNLPPKKLRLGDGRVIMAIPDQPWPPRSPRRRLPCRGEDSSPSRCAGRTGGGTRKAVPTTALVRSQSDLYAFVKGSVNVCRTYAVVARALFKLILYDAVVLWKYLRVEAFRNGHSFLLDLCRSLERMRRRKSAFTIHCRLQRLGVVFVCRGNLNSVIYSMKITSRFS